MSLKALTDLRGEAQKCIRCSACKMAPLPVYRNPEFGEACPIFQHYRFHAYSGSGLQIMAMSVADGRSQPDQKMADVVFSCRACGYCDVACKYIMDADRNGVNMALREHMVEEGLAPKEFQTAVDNLRKTGYAGSTPEKSPGAWAKELQAELKLKKVPQQKAEVLLYAGCTQRTDPAAAKSAQKLARLLVKAGVDVGILADDEPCCGLPAYWTGFRDAFTEQGAKTASVLDGAGVKTVVTVSGSCLGTLRSKYNSYGNDLTVNVVHATEFLLQLIEKRRLKLTVPVKTTATYHDPCYLGRHSEVSEKWAGEMKTVFGGVTYADPPKKINYGTQGVYDAPRRLLEAIPGLRFTEMYRIREYSYCCGAGGGVAAQHAEMAKQTAQHRLAEAADVGAECLVTACSHCERHFRESQPGCAQAAMPVMDMIDLISQAAGLEEA